MGLEKRPRIGAPYTIRVVVDDGGKEIEKDVDDTDDLEKAREIATAQDERTVVYGTLKGEKGVARVPVLRTAPGRRLPPAVLTEPLKPAVALRSPFGNPFRR